MRGQLRRPLGMLTCAESQKEFLRFEELFDFLHPGFGARVVAAGILAADRLEFLQQLLLTPRQVHRCLDDDVAEEIAVRRGPYAFDAFAAQAENSPALRFLR